MDLEEVIGVVALRGKEARVADQSAEERLVQAMHGAGARDHVLLHHHAAHVVGAEAQGHLADVRAHGDPAGTDRVDVVEVQAAGGLRAQVLGGAGHADAAAELRMHVLGAAAVEVGHGIAGEGLREVVSRALAPLLGAAERRVFPLERPGDERLVAAAALGGEVRDGAVLPAARHVHVVHAVGMALDVPEHHGARGVHAQLVRHVHGGEPRLGGALAQADLGAHRGSEDLAAAARDAGEAGLLELRHDAADLLLVGGARRIEEVDELHELRRAEGVHVHLREAALDLAEEVEVPVERELGVHAALHEDLRAADGDELLDLLQERVVGERVGVAVARVAPERAERALGGADVRVVDVAVDDVGADVVAVDLAAAAVRPHAEVGERHVAQEAQPLFRRQARGTGDHGLHEGGVRERVDGGVQGRGGARGHGSRIVGGSARSEGRRVANRGRPPRP